MAKIEKVTAEEIKSAKSDEASVSSNRVNFSVAKNKSKTEFIKKLKLEQIEKFFEQFDVISISKVPDDKDPKWVYVKCNFFDVTFNDFESTFNFETANDGAIANPKFDAQAFSRYCEQINVYPDQAIASLMATELFGKNFVPYATAKYDFDSKAEKNAFNELPRNLRKTCAYLSELKQSQNKSEFNKLTFGECNIEDSLLMSSIMGARKDD